MSSPSETFDLCKILSEARQLTKSHVLPFQLLSLIFLLPLSFSIIIYPILQKTVFNSQLVSNLPAQVLINFFYIFFVIILFVFGVASISYSTFQALCGAPVDLITSIKSISQSFFPLLSTLIIQELTLALISFSFIYQAIRTYASESFYKSSPYYVAFIIVLTLVFLLVLIYLRAKLILVSVIVVVESKWGLEPMNRSAELVKGKRGLTFSMVLLFGLMVGGSFLGNFGQYWSWWFVICMVPILTMVLLRSLVANVVLYANCLEMHGEGLPHSSLREVPLLK